jgi:hypothetical protein
MHLAERIRSSIGTLASSLIIVGLLLPAAAVAENAANKAKSPTAPPASLSLDPNSSALPPAALGEDAGQVKFGEPDDKEPDLKFPDRIKLGDHTLQFDTSRKSIDTIPRVGVDATDPHVLNQATPPDSDLLLKPNYFGLTLTVPTH